MTRPSRSGVSGSKPFLPLALLAAVLLLVATACSSPAAGNPAAAGRGSRTLYLGAIPDQDQDHLQQIYGTLAAYLSDRLGVPVKYRPVTDYTAAVAQFRTGDLDLVWFGGLTGVQARLQTPGARVLVQRDIDGSFHSLFVVNRSTGVAPFHHASGLTALKGLRFTYGSNSSTSGYLMPAYYLMRAGVDPDHGFYHWVLGATATKKFGPRFADKVKQAFLGISSKDPRGRRLLHLFGCHAFVPTSADNHRRIEAVGRRLGLLQPTS